MSGQPELTLRPVHPTTHAQPDFESVDRSLRCSYSPSSDGVDSNLLILFHGLGDTSRPFAQLGSSLKLPQTAVLSLQGPQRVPLLEEEAWQWWESFDSLGERTSPFSSLSSVRPRVADLPNFSLRLPISVLSNPNPSSTLSLLLKVLAHLTTVCAWHPSQLHFFGFAQGASVAGELALLHSRHRPAEEHLGSVVAVSGGLLSHPTVEESKRAATKVCLVYRKGEDRVVSASSWRKGFREVREVKLEAGRGREGMPRGMDEWREIMRFWSEVLVRKSALERGGHVYELAGGMAAAQAAGARPPAAQ
ncbi:hypothetical protein JCM21900_005108 [Sporobolomyces salmonicolor]